MKIIVITALYPPYHLGGYELRCQNVVERLRTRGHQVHVVTSIYGLEGPHVDDEVSRVLHLEPSKTLWQRIRWDTHDLRFITRLLKEASPDVIHLWHMAELARTFYPFFARCNIPIVYDEGGNGLTLAWKNHGRWMSFCEGQSSSSIKSIIKRLMCRLIATATGVLPYRWAWPNMHTYFNSQQSLEAAQLAGVVIHKAQVIYSGVDTDTFQHKPRSPLQAPLRIVVPGRVVPIKGVRDAIRAFAEVHRRIPHRENRLTIAGPITDTVYYQQLQQQIDALDIKNQVEFTGQLGAKDMPHLYQTCDFCLFVSRQPYGLSRIPLEAMACGTVVISVGNEGSREVIQHEKTGFLVPENDAEAIAQIIHDLHSRPDRYVQISESARSRIETAFTIEKSVDQIESILQEAMAFRSEQ